MDIQAKFDEADFFLSKMKKHYQDPELKFYLSAFLSAGRSPLQYIYSRAKSMHRKDCYDRLVSGNDLIKFFKCQRNINIHSHAVKRAIKMDVSDTVGVDDSIDDGQTKLATLSEGEELKYTFSGWSSSDNEIVALSERYLEEVKNIFQRSCEVGLVQDG